MCTAPWRQLNPPLQMVPLTALGAFLITALTTPKSGATEQSFIVRLTTFKLLNLRKSLTCELPIKNYNGF